MHCIKYVVFWDFNINRFQARSCLYASTQLNPHYFDKKNFFSKTNVVWNSAAFARSDNYHTEYFINHIALIVHHTVVFFLKSCRPLQLFKVGSLHAPGNGFSLVKKALRGPQNAPNRTIYFKIFRGACPLTPPRLFWIHIIYRLATRLFSYIILLIATDQYFSISGV